MTPTLSWEVHTCSPGLPIFSAQGDGLTFEIYERPAEGTGRNRTPASFVLWHSGRACMLPVSTADECKRYAQSVLAWREVARQPDRIERLQYLESKFDVAGAEQ